MEERKTVEVKIFFTNGMNEEMKTLLILRPEDIERTRGYRTEKDKISRLISAYLKRKYVGNWRISESGKPISDEKKFNVSHCDGAVAIALSDREVGVDVERIRPISEDVKRRFSEGELISDEDFFKLWTSKESLVKAEGSGFDIRPEKVPVIPFDGVKEYRTEKYFSRLTIIRDLVISVTAKGEEEFKLDIKTEPNA